MKNSYIVSDRLKEKLDTKKNRKRKLSSQMWLQRQLNDVYVKSARAEGYYARSAYKLIEINNKFHILKSGMKVIDVGSAPGSWSQVIAKIIFNQASAQLIAIDLLPMKPVNCQFIQGDFTDTQILQQIKAKLSQKVDVILSDMAPNTTGIKSIDHLKIMALVEITLQFALEVLALNGTLVVKVFQGGAENSVLELFKQNFKMVKHYKPQASRSKSSEMYLIAMGFKGYNINFYNNQH